MASEKSKKMQCNFRQKFFSGLSQLRLDNIFISHNFQEVDKNSEILCSMSIILLFFILFKISTYIKKVQPIGI